MKASGPKAKQSYDELPEHIKRVASVPGTIPCLKCQKLFKSPDRVRVRLCGRCDDENLTDLCSRSMPLTEGILEEPQ